MREGVIGGMISGWALERCVENHYGRPYEEIVKMTLGGAEGADHSLLNVEGHLMWEIGTLGFTIIDLGVGVLILIYAGLLSEGRATDFLLRTAFFLSLYLAGRAHDILLRSRQEEPPER